MSGDWSKGYFTWVLLIPKWIPALHNHIRFSLKYFFGPFLRSITKVCHIFCSVEAFWYTGMISRFLHKNGFVKKNNYCPLYWLKIIVCWQSGSTSLSKFKKIFWGKMDSFLNKYLCWNGEIVPILRGMKALSRENEYW